MTPPGGSTPPDASTGAPPPTPARFATTVGPLALTISVDPDRAEATAEARLGGQIVERQLLTLLSPSLPLDVMVDTEQAKGTLTLEMRPPPSYSAVRADITASNAGQPSIYRGDVASWIANDEPIVFEHLFVIGALLSTRTTVRGFEGNIASMEFISGAETIGEATTTTANPLATFPAITVGEVKIAANATITLTIPTASQQGILMLQATLLNEPAGDDVVSSAVASWPLP